MGRASSADRVNRKCDRSSPAHTDGDGPICEAIGVELPDVHPVEAFIARLVSPSRGEAWVKFREETLQRQRDRALEVLGETERATGLDAEGVFDAVRDQEQVADLFLALMEVAIRTRWHDKLRALGRVLAQGLVADSDTAFDSTEVIGRIVGELFPPHVRALALISERGPFNPGLRPTDALGDWLSGTFPGIGPATTEVGAFLIRNGLVTNPFYANGVLRITDLGEFILNLTRETDPGADPAGSGGPPA